MIGLTGAAWHIGWGLWLWCKGSLVQLQVKSRVWYTLLLAPLLHMTFRAGAVNDNELTVSSDQGIMPHDWLFIPPWASWKTVLNTEWSTQVKWKIDKFKKKVFFEKEKKMLRGHIIFPCFIFSKMTTNSIQFWVLVSTWKVLEYFHSFLCVYCRYLGNAQSSNMAVIDVGLYSGFRPYKNSLDKVMIVV